MITKVDKTTVQFRRFRISGKRTIVQPLAGEGGKEHFGLLTAYLALCAFEQHAYVSLYVSCSRPSEKRQLGSSDC